MKKVLMSVGVIAMAGASVFAGIESARGQASGIYAKRTDGTGNCVQLATSGIGANVQTSLVTTAATINSSDGSTPYFLYESGCSNPVYFTGQ
jgi:hypothetical protein